MRLEDTVAMEKAAKNGHTCIVVEGVDEKHHHILYIQVHAISYNGLIYLLAQFGIYNVDVHNIHIDFLLKYQVVMVRHALGFIKKYIMLKSPM